MCMMCALSVDGHLDGFHPRIDGLIGYLSGTGAAAVDPGPYDPVESLDTGARIDGRVIDVVFAPPGYQTPLTSYGRIDAEAFSDYEIARFESAFDMIEAVIDVEFRITTDPDRADLTLVLDSDDLGGATLGFMYFPLGTALDGLGVFNGALWDDGPGGDLEDGGIGMTTIVHELLHGLGLAHPHDDVLGTDVLAGVLASSGSYGIHELNQGIFTTMSYNRGWSTGEWGAPRDFDGRWGSELGPMALDIAALQRLYGPNLAHATGDDVYRLPDVNDSGTYWRALWDAGGIDTIVYDGMRDLRIDLNAATLEGDYGGGGPISSAMGIAGGFTIAHGVVIENAFGGAGSDNITGNGVANTLRGEAGDDALLGGGGDDELHGGTGDDWLDGGEGDDVLRGGPGRDVLYGGSGQNVLNGQRHGDTLHGGDDRDILRGGGGSDTIWGHGGDDRIKGGTRRDIAHGGDGDDIISGNRHDDTLFGGAGDDRLNGGGGDDWLEGGSGNDWLRGGEGADRFVFRPDFGRDRIDDFDPGLDRLLIDSAIAPDLDAAEIAARVLRGAEGLVLDFGADQVLFLDGLDTTDGLAGAILLGSW
ncbi:MAG: Peptidase M10 serralysin C terminal [Rhodobacteraceae bacterium HLUCCA08]|nr:MAG: Peptidase M10 serralysin C terminal [Rhodobacteraceae bacterium HLUCCA08]